MFELPQLARQSSSLKRPPQHESSRGALPPTKKPLLAENPTSTVGSSSSGNRTAPPSNRSSAVSGDAKAVDEFSGLTLRVVPYEPSPSPSSSNTNGTPSLLSLQESTLAPLTRPLLKVNGKTVAVDQIQRFIHKRLGGPEAFLPKAIEILRDGVIQHSSWRIGQLPHSPSGVVIETPNPSARPDGTIILAYRRK
jgi:hypothetical protein